MARAISSISAHLSYNSLRSYGAFTLSFGIVTLLLNLTKYYVLANPAVEQSVLITGAVFLIISVPLLIIDKPLCIVLQDFPLTDYVLFEFLQIKRLNRIKNPPTIPIIVSICLGIFPAVIGFIFSLDYVLLTLLILLVVVLSFESLEFPTILALLLAPYLAFIPGKTYVIAGISILSFISYLFRVLIGKRVYHLDFYSAAIVVFGVFMTVSALIGHGDESRNNAWLYLALLLGYFPASGLVVNRRLTDATIKAIVFSTLPISLYALVIGVIDVVENGFSSIASFYYGPLAEGENSFILSTYLLISALFTLMFFFEKNRKIKRTFYFLFFIVDVLAIATVSQPGAVIALVMSLILAVFVFNKSKAGYVLLPISILPYFIPLINNSYLEKISHALNFKTPLNEIADKLYENVKVALDNPFFGIGIGKDSYDAYLGESGCRAGNLFLGIASSIGIVALIVLLVAITLKFVQDSAYSRYVKYSSVHVASAMSTTAVAALIIQGAFGNIFESPELFFTFFVIFGISSATLRVAKKETDDRLNYYGDARSSQTSAIDVNIA